MGHARLSDVFALGIAMLVGAGVYSIFVYFRQVELAPTFFGITVVVFCCFEYCLSYAIKNKIKNKRGKKYAATRPQVQERLQVQERTSFEEYKYCIKCSSEMKKDLKICTKCGQPFEV